jgi:hypothetical protein
VGVHGVGPVGKNTVLPIPIPKQAQSSQQQRITMMRIVVDKRKDSGKRTIVLADTVAIAENGGKP